MFATLKGAALYVAGGIVVAVIGAATYLTSNGNLTGADWLVIITPILTGVVGITFAHTTGQAVGAALQTPPPGYGVVPVQPPAPVVAPPAPPA